MALPCLPPPHTRPLAARPCYHRCDGRCPRAWRQQQRQGGTTRICSPSRSSRGQAAAPGARGSRWHLFAAPRAGCNRRRLLLLPGCVQCGGARAGLPPRAGPAPQGLPCLASRQAGPPPPPACGPGPRSPHLGPHRHLSPMPQLTEAAAVAVEAAAAAARRWLAWWSCLQTRARGAAVGGEVGAVRNGEGVLLLAGGGAAFLARTCLGEGEGLLLAALLEGGSEPAVLSLQQRRRQGRIPPASQRRGGARV